MLDIHYTTESDQRRDDFKKEFFYKYFNTPESIDHITNKSSDELLIVLNSSERFIQKLPRKRFLDTRYRRNHPDIQGDSLERNIVPTFVINGVDNGNIDLRCLNQTDHSDLPIKTKIGFYDIDIKNKTLLPLERKKGQLDLFAQKSLEYMRRGFQASKEEDCHAFRDFIRGENPTTRRPLKYYNESFTGKLRPGMVISCAPENNDEKLAPRTGFQFTHSAIALTETLFLSKQTSGGLYVQDIQDLIRFRRTPLFYFQYPDLDELLAYSRHSESKKSLLRKKLKDLYPRSG